MEPVGLKAKIVRSPHRSTMFMLQFDISPLIDHEGNPVESGETMEEILYEWCRRGVRDALARGREKVPNHP